MICTALCDANDQHDSREMSSVGFLDISVVKQFPNLISSLGTSGEVKIAAFYSPIV